jgi:hypothetical protein
VDGIFIFPKEISIVYDRIYSIHSYVKLGFNDLRQSRRNVLLTAQSSLKNHYLNHRHRRSTNPGTVNCGSLPS